MDNLVSSQVIKTTLSGTIEGKEVTINYENQVGALPANVSAVCAIPDAVNPMLSTNISVNVNIMGNKNITVSGVVVTGDISLLLQGIESSIQAILVTPAP